MQSSLRIPLFIFLLSFTICNGFASDDGEDEDVEAGSNKDTTIILEHLNTISTKLDGLQANHETNTYQEKAKNFLYQDAKNLTLAAVYFGAAGTIFLTDYYVIPPSKDTVRLNGKYVPGFIKEDVSLGNRLTRVPSSLALPAAAVGLYHLGQVSIINYGVVQPTKRVFTWGNQKVSNVFNRFSTGYYQTFSTDKKNKSE